MITTINEFKKTLKIYEYKLGDRWSRDFDYDGMLKYAMSVDLNLKKLKKLNNSFEDVNYHDINRQLFKAIQYLENGNKRAALNALNAFKIDVEDEYKQNESKKLKHINEGQFSWFTQDTNQQIGSMPSNKILVYMYDNKGNVWKEEDYEGYGEFGGKDYYDLVAEMNGYTPDRQIGIQLAFYNIESKNEDGKVLFPALVTDPNYDISKHDFTVEPESDPNQSWYYDDEQCHMCGGYNTEDGICFDCEESQDNIYDFEDEDEDEDDYYENKINEEAGIPALPVNVYRSSMGDSTNNGLTSKKDNLMLVFDGVKSPFKTKEGEDYLVLDTVNVGGKTYTFAVPKSIKDSGKHSMFGGNFIYTSDSRFPFDNPIKVHDRVE